MTPLFLIGTLLLISLLYWAAYQSERALKSNAIEIKGNLLLSLPELVIKIVLLGICVGLANSLDVGPGKVCTSVEFCVGLRGHFPTLVEILIGLVVGVVTVFVVNLVSITAIRIWGKKIYSPDVIKSLIPRNQIEWVLILFPLLVAVSIEELLFRGLLIGGFQLLINPWAMALASSILFGLMHSPQGRLGVVLTGLVGFIFGALFIITNSLLVVIVTHFVVNLLQIMRAQEDLAWYERFENTPGWQTRRPVARLRSDESETEEEASADLAADEAAAPLPTEPVVKS